jgi:hypothetical protein
MGATKAAAGMSKVARRRINLMTGDFQKVV